MRTHMSVSARRELALRTAVRYKKDRACERDGVLS